MPPAELGILIFLPDTIISSSLTLKPWVNWLKILLAIFLFDEFIGFNQVFLPISKDFLQSFPSLRM